ncbi:hypothetical protein VTK73DRAFT_7534 [Phialemonium thermophilum]|uniref:Uncharacterized protein n=1 Tax=Phialemonium thermophilum TaxID=223376 RepID=A0ABR3WDR0_9PEZI
MVKLPKSETASLFSSETVVSVGNSNLPKQRKKSSPKGKSLEKQAIERTYPNTRQFRRHDQLVQLSYSSQGWNNLLRKCYPLRCKCQRDAGTRGRFSTELNYGCYCNEPIDSVSVCNQPTVLRNENLWPSLRAKLQFQTDVTMLVSFPKGQRL